MTDRVVITERWYRDRGYRKIGNGDWEPIDLTVYGGIVPVFIFNPLAEWVQRETWESSPEKGEPKP